MVSNRNSPPICVLKDWGLVWGSVVAGATEGAGSVPAVVH